MKSKIGGSTYCKRDLKSEVENLQVIDCDFAELDLGLPMNPDKEFQDKLKEVKDILPIPIGHLPEIDFKKEEIERCKKFIEILAKINCKIFIIHLFSRNLPTKNNLNEKIKSLKELTDFAAKQDSILALENTEEDVKTLKKVFDKINRINFCLDIGHANLFTKENRSISLINNFGKILKHVHTHDNFGGYAEKWDLHLPIGAGNIKFMPIFKKLREINYSGNISLEIYNPDKEYRKISIKRIKELL